jgi:hypothetical protein
MFSLGVTGGRILGRTEEAGDNRNDRRNRSSLPRGLPPACIFEAMAKTNEGRIIFTPLDTLKERSEKPPSLQLES